MTPAPLPHAPLAQQTSDFVPMATDPAAFAAWPDGLRDEMLRNVDNGCVGSVLVSETEKVRVWHLLMKPGERFPFHRHVNPYFWTCHSDGSARTYYCDGRIQDFTYTKGLTRHYHYGADEFMMHSLQNTGEADLLFTTVEFLDGPNTPLAIPNHMRLAESA